MADDDLEFQRWPGREMTDYFFDVDGHDEPTLWRRGKPDRPEAVLQRCRNPEAYDLLVRLLDNPPAVDREALAKALDAFYGEVDYLPTFEQAADAILSAGILRDADEVRRPLLQAMWDALGILGFDQDGDKTYGARVTHGWERFASEFLEDVRRARADHDEAVDEVLLPYELREVKAQVWDNCVGWFGHKPQQVMGSGHRVNINVLNAAEDDNPYREDSRFADPAHAEYMSVRADEEAGDEHE